MDGWIEEEEEEQKNARQGPGTPLPAGLRGEVVVVSQHFQLVV